MARLRSPNFEDRQAEIAQIAAELFARDGYHATSINNIAQESGTAKSRLYHYFTSKEDVLYTLLKSHAEDLKSRLLIALQIDGNAQTRLLKFTNELLAVNVHARNTHTLILNELNHLRPDHEAEIRGLLRAPIEDLYDLLTEINPQLGRGKKIRFPSAMLLLGMINWSHVWFDAEDKVSTEDYANMICETFLGGFSSVKL